MEEQKRSNYLRGAALLAATVAVTKVIGAIYKIPLYNLLGDEGTTHFQVTYVIYNLLLTISTAGVPVALSRLISEALATGRHRQAKQYFSVGLSAFIIVGFVGMAVMLLVPQKLASLMGDPEIINGIRALAPAVLFACTISVYRGYAQGHSNMIPTAISQIMEVLCKLVFGITIAWYLSKAGYGLATVSAGAIVGVTIGLGLAVPVLVFYKRKMDKSLPASGGRLDRLDSKGATLAQILRIGIPITLSSSVLNIITLIDTKLVLLRLQTGAGFSFQDAKILYGVYSKGLTLFNIPSAFIVPVTVSVVPAIAAAIARKRSYEAKDIMESSLKLTNLLALPAGVGLCVLSYPIFNVLYPGSNENGPMLLAMLGIASFFVCTQLMTNAILQASGYEKLALLTLPFGGIIKIAVNWFLVGTPGINITGAPVGTLVCYLFMTVMNISFIMWKIKDRPNFLKITVRPVICTAVMGVAAASIYGIIFKVCPPSFTGSRLGLLAALLASILAGVVIYGILIIALRAVTRADMKLIPKGERLADLLHIR
ncbi:MAG: oligosaccharide flippase family protein [Oscillospiraceae bacterium]